ncbi:MAG: hypothetical protein ACJ749_00255 [Flavisolibacter sp.]
MVLAIAGRRIDKPGTAPVFPLENVEMVRKKIAEFLISKRPVSIVSSAACGADLIALEAAGELGIERYVMLPYAPEIFKTASVTDRPGKWEMIFDTIIEESKKSSRLILLDFSINDKNAFEKTNTEILNKAAELSDSGKNNVQALIVWDGKAKDNDITLHFKKEAEEKGYTINEINTVKL